MAVQMKAYTPTTSQIASSKLHLERRDDPDPEYRWRYYWSEGVRYIRMRSACSGKMYQVRADGQGCSCKWYETGHAICAHMLSAREALHRDALAAWVDDQERSTGNRAGVLGYLDAVERGDDHETARAAGHRARVTYEDVWPEGG